MKTKTWVLLALAYFVVAIGYASDFPKMNVVAVETNKVLLDYNSKEATPLEITLSEQNGDILAFKRTSKRFNKYQEVFDFSDLGKGSYCLCVNFGNRSVSRIITVKKQGVSVGAPQRLFAPSFILKDKTLNISLYNCPQKPVYLSVYQQGKYVDGAVLGSGLTVHKRLDLSRLEKGKYEIVVTDYFKDHQFVAQL